MALATPKKRLRACRPPVRRGPPTTYLVYEVRFRHVLTGQVTMMYVGRTSRLLSRRKAEHLAEVAKGSNRPFHVALRAKGFKVTWVTMWKGTSKHLSLLEEQRRIKVAVKESGCLVLNCTRGGYYDHQDSQRYKR